jgi:hypothetical protein
MRCVIENKSRNLLRHKSLDDGVKIKRPRSMAGPFDQVLIYRKGFFYPLISLGSIM